LRFVFVNPYFPPYAPGGAEYSLEQICKCFPQKGWSVNVVTQAWDGRPRKEIFPGYTIERIPSPVIMTPGQDDEARAYVFSRRYVTDVLKALMTTGCFSRALPEITDSGDREGCAADLRNGCVY
jgi:hypothetical protein